MKSEPGQEGKKRKPTRDDVARRAGVSATTVSYVISGRTDVQLQEATRQRVWQAAEELGYRRNAVATALMTGRTGIIAFWIDDLLTAYHASIVHHVEAQAASHPYQLVIKLTNHTRQRTPMDAAVAALPAEGMIVEGHEVLVRELKAAHLHVPMVSIGAYSRFEPSVDSVGIDLSVGATEAVQHLVQRGGRRIALLDTTSELSDQPRPTAYRTVMAQAGLPCEYIVVSNQSRRVAREGIREYVSAHGCPDAVFCLNDDMMIGTYRGLCDLGIRVPEQVALVGCDGIEETEYGYCPLSTIVMPVAEMCELAWQLLERRLREPDAPIEHLVMPAHLVVRQSSS